MHGPASNFEKPVPPLIPTAVPAGPLAGDPPVMAAGAPSTVKQPTQAMPNPVVEVEPKGALESLT